MEHKRSQMHERGMSKKCTGGARRKGAWRAAPRAARWYAIMRPPPRTHDARTTRARTAEYDDVQHTSALTLHGSDRVCNKERKMSMRGGARIHILHILR